MKAMKTVEEMRVAVLAECEQLCPKEGDQWIDEVIGLRIRCAMTNSNWKESKIIWIANAHGASVSVSPREKDNTAFVYLYRLLGLSERDAVADTQAFYESLFADLKKSDLQLVEIYAQAEVGRLQAEKRNAALVAAAELVIKRNWERINGDGSDYSLFSQAIGNLGDAIAANEKGGANG